MYINKVHVTNIKVFDNQVFDFEGKPGWHVLIGDNGTGKSTLLKLLSISLVGIIDLYESYTDSLDWVRSGSVLAKFGIVKTLNRQYDTLNNGTTKEEVTTEIRQVGGLKMSSGFNNGKKLKGHFSCAFGSYRQIGNKTTAKKNKDNFRRIDAHITLFDNSYSLNHALDWLQQLKFEVLDKELRNDTFEALITFINDSDLLPNKSS